MKRLLVVLALSACATAPPEPKRETAPDELLSLTPAEPHLLAELDVARLRAWEPAQKLLAMLPPEQRAAAAAQIGFDPVSDVDRVVVWLRRAGPVAGNLLLATGRFDAARIRGAAEQHGGHEVEERGVMRIEVGPTASVALSSRLFVLGRVPRVRDAIAVWKGAANALGAEEPIMKVRRTALGQGAAVFRLAALSPDNPAQPPQMRSLALRADVGDGGLDLTATLEHDSPDRAVSTEQQLRDTIEDLRRQLAAMGLDSFLDGVIIAGQGTRVVATVRLSREQCDRLVELASRLLPLLDKRMLPESL